MSKPGVSNLLSRTQIATALTVSERTIDRWTKRGWLPYLKMGAKGTRRATTLFDENEVRRALERRFKVNERSPV